MVILNLKSNQLFVLLTVKNKLKICGIKVQRMKISESLIKQLTIETGIGKIKNLSTHQQDSYKIQGTLDLTAWMV